ncbi:unnamed protein product [Bemisia tabaci]|uniref:Uncharacterized protein n=1 Tax=Bemisia tabaci TaxID=7038 RepID=A0A9P0A7B5_BEMTA|nr:unnamed protein product [Bemisia tabaci]
MCNIDNESVFLSNTNNDSFVTEQDDEFIDYNDMARLQSRSSNNKSLNFMAWNCGGLSGVKAEEFNVTLRDFNVDIALLSETWFTKNDFKRGENEAVIRVPPVIRKNSENSLIARRIKSFWISLLHRDPSTLLEAVFVGAEWLNACKDCD